MTNKIVQGRISQLAYTLAEWTTKNPVLLKGEVGFEVDTNKLKIGDGVHTYSELPYIVDINDIQEDLKYSNSTQMLIKVGGYDKGTTFDAQTIKQMFDGLLYPYVAPTVNSCTASPQNGGTYEYGRSFSITGCTVNITKGARDISKVEIKNGSTVVATKEGDDVKDGGAISFTFDAIPVASGASVALTALVTDSDGKSYSKNTGSYSWLYPFYHGVVEKAAAELSATDVQVGKDLAGKSQKSYSFTTNNNKAMIAYPKSYGTLKKITDGSGVTDYTNAFGSPATISLSSTDPAWGPIDYYVYTSGNATASNFQYKFNF